MRDLHSNIKVVSLIDPIIGNNDSEGTPAAGLNTLGFDSAELIALIGAAGDTLSGSVKIDIILQDSADDSAWAAVTNANYVLAGSGNSTFVPASGIIATIDGTADDNTEYRVGYVGPKQYCRLFFDFTGTHTNGTPIAELGVLSNASRAPTSD